VKKAVKNALDTTGALRDLDVFISKRREFEGILAPEAAKGLSAIFAHIKRKRKKELARVKAYLGTKEYGDLYILVSELVEAGLAAPRTAVWGASQQAGDAAGSGVGLHENTAGGGAAPPAHARPSPSLSLETQTDSREGGTELRNTSTHEYITGTAPIIEIVSRLCEGRYPAFAQNLGKISKKSDENALHRFRISLKKVRYLLEFFEPLFSRRKVKPLLKGLRRLQDALGVINDRDIELATVFASRDEMPPSGRRSSEMLTSLGALGQQLFADKKKAKKKLFSLIGKNLDTLANTPIAGMLRTPK
jgi:CHAD domain-containing protein